VGVPAVVLSNSRPGDDWLGFGGPIAGTTALSVTGLLDLVGQRYGSIAATGVGALAGGVLGLALAKPVARVVGDPPAAGREGDDEVVAQAFAIARETPTGRAIVDRLEADGVDVRLVNDLGGSGRELIAGQHNYVSDRIFLSREEGETPELLAESLIHEGQHHIDDISAFEGASLLGRGALEERMLDNEVAAFRTGATAMLELLDTRAPGYVEALQSGREPRELSPAASRVIEALRKNYGIDPETLELQDAASLRHELDEMGYASLL